MRILHITDYHFKSGVSSRFDQENILDSFIQTLKSESCDFVFFTGDLVFSGTDQSDFKNAWESLFLRLKKELNLNPNQIFICPGNHDIDRSKILKSLNTFFDSEIKNNDDLNKFINDKNADYEHSLEPSKNYNKFATAFYNDEKDKTHDLFSWHLREVDENKVGIVTINSAWRSVGDDEGKLLFPIDLLKESLLHIKDANCKILLIHHPLHWFKSWNYYELQNLIHKSFHMLFSGHIHQDQISSHYLSNNGILSHSSPATLTYENNTILGFSILEYNFNNEDQIIVKDIKYDKNGKELLYDKIHVTIPCGERKEKQNQIRKKVISKYQVEMNKANELLLNSVDEDDNDKFIELFNNPVLKKKSRAELSGEDAITNFNFELIFSNDSNYVLLGGDKSGKTSILKRIQLYHLKNYSKNGNVPFFIDYDDFDGKIISEGFSLIKLVKNYFEISYTSAKSLITDHKFRLLIDNYDPRKALTPFIQKFLTEYPGVNYIAVTNQTSARTMDIDAPSGNDYVKLYIHELNRREIRSFANKWKEVKLSQKDKIIDRIVGLCKQLEIPANYWTLSLFLLVHHKLNHDSTRNLFEILDICVEEILNKKFIVLTRSRIQYDHLKQVCAEIAHKLLINHRSTIYSTSYSQLLSYIDTYLKSNIRVSADPKEILDYLVTSGIIKHKDDNSYTFRLNGIFEYFLAYYLTLHKEFKEEIISDDSIYLSFKNELEIYSGLRKDDKEFLIKIYEKTRSYFDGLNTIYSEMGSPDEVLSFKIQHVYGLQEMARKMKAVGPYTKEEQDEMLEEISPLEGTTEIRKKKLFDLNKTNPDILERYLTILARVFKNTEGVKDYPLVAEIFDFLLKTYISFGFYLMDEIENSNTELWDSNNHDEDWGYNILKIISSIIPIVTQVTMYDGLGHYNIENIIKGKIKQLEDDSKNNQYQLFLLYLLLIDIDTEKNNKYLDELIDILEKGVLKTSLVFKLNYYLAFRAYDQPDFAAKIRKLIQKAQLKIDSKTDHGFIHKRIDEQGKKNIIKRLKDK